MTERCEIHPDGVTERVCTNCGQTSPCTNHPLTTVRGYRLHRSICRECYAAYHRQWRERQGEKLREKERERWTRRRSHGIGDE